MTSPEQFSFEGRSEVSFTPAVEPEASAESSLPSTPEELRDSIAAHERKAQELEAELDSRIEQPGVPLDMIDNLRTEIDYHKQMVRLEGNRLAERTESSEI